MKRSEYETKAAEFRSLLLAEAEKPQDEQVWPEPDEWLSVQGTSTCTTPTCRLFGYPVAVTLYENADSIYRGQCGICKEPTDARPALEDD